jgi:hypothetical protein
MSSQTLLHRVPDPVDKNRMARFTEIVAGIFNSLFRQGLLVYKGGQTEFAITIEALSGVGPPAAALGQPGAIYFDVTDPNNLLFYFKT